MTEDAAARRLIESFARRGWRLAIAESCTGGALSTRITATAGSSAVFVGSVIPYADQVKTGLLEIPAELIAHHGAVSQEVAVAMARAVRARLGANVGLAITGIAGPGGARPGKPVGLVFIAVADPFGEDHVERHEWGQDRDGNRAASVDRAVSFLTELASDLARESSSN